jgi:hypothetical protein
LPKRSAKIWEYPISGDIKAFACKGTDLNQEKAVQILNILFLFPSLHQRICGPYEVFSLSTIPHGAVPIHLDGKKVIVFREAHPECGLWFDRSSVERTIDGCPVKFRQIASEYDFFPFRFAIHRYRDFNVQYVLHVEPCWLCV